MLNAPAAALNAPAAVVNAPTAALSAPASATFLDGVWHFQTPSRHPQTLSNTMQTPTDTIRLQTSYSSLHIAFKWSSWDQVSEPRQQSETIIKIKRITQPPIFNPIWVGHKIYTVWNVVRLLMLYVSNGQIGIKLQDRENSQRLWNR